ncbi:MAG: GNAT family N-acetyltransferase [Gemmatimonadota bacterium]|nr:GNAT family N-acetyltransferase [Gemmatimonadota bacterium]
MTAIREARNEDTADIIEVYRASYGEDYADPRYYEPEEIRKLIYSDDTLVLVAEVSRRVVGTACVILEVGAYTDLVGEFGRLAVHPDFRRRGIGTGLLRRRVECVRDRLHVGIIEARVTHPFTQYIAREQRFAPVGFLPQKYRFGARREHVGVLVRLFGRALELRRNHPRVTSELYPLACEALENCGIGADVIVEDEAAAYPFGHGFAVSELTTEGYSRLMRIERGRVRNREVFGPLRLQYGFFKLISHNSKYLVAREDAHIAGAIGFTLERHDRVVRVFELITRQDEAIRYLLRELERRCHDEWDISYLEMDVSAHAPRMQRTLLQLGWVPVAYVPALAFHDVERLDVVKFVRLLAPLDLGDVALIPPVNDIVRLVLAAFRRRDILPRIGELAGHTGLFQGLEEEQLERLAAAFRHAAFEPGAEIFREGEPCDELHLVLAGEVEIRRSDTAEPLGCVRAGECLGEVALLTGGDHSATAVALGPVETGVLAKSDLASLVRLRPGIGVVVYRNLARGLGEKLRRADRMDPEDATLA